MGDAMNEKAKSWLGYLTIVVILVFIATIVYNKFLFLWLDILLVLIALIFGYLVYKQKIPKPLIITGLIIMMVISFGLFYSQSLIERAFKPIEVETSVISFLSLNDSNIQTIEDGYDYRCGISNSLNEDLKELCIENTDYLLIEFSFTDPLLHLKENMLELIN